MKFLTIATTKDTYSTLPQSEKNKLMVSNIEWTIDQIKKSEKKAEFYLIPGWGRLVSIGEANSVEEYYQGLQSPLAQAGYVNYESYPLIEVDVKAFEAWLESLKAAK